jgi:hypothetical protein
MDPGSAAHHSASLRAALRPGNAYRFRKSRPASAWADACLAANVPKRLSVISVDLDPEHVEVGDRAQYFQISFGLGVEIEIEQQIDVLAGAVVERLHQVITERVEMPWM